MRASSTLFLLLPCIASLENVLNEDSSFNHMNLTAMHNGMQELRHHLLETLGTEISESQKNMLKEYNKHPHHLNITHVNKQGDSIDEINEKNKLSEDLYQMDIMLTPHQIDEITHADSNNSTRARRQAYKPPNFPNTLWDKKTVTYFYDASIGDKAKEVIASAINFWQSNTCLTFTEDSKAKDAIRFKKGTGCFSAIGFVGGIQDISIGQGCETASIAAHEVAHALGFVHMQERNDRDSYITVNMANVKPDWADQFNKRTSSTNFNYGLPYDLGSIMQYNTKIGSSNGKDTMVPKNFAYRQTMGSAIVGFIDVFMMNKLYSCTEDCKALPLCKNGGYPHPRDCSKCQCPGGFGGKLCDEKPPGCGRVLAASAAPQIFSSELIGDGTEIPKNEFQQCTHWIVAPKGKLIEARLTGITSPACILGCIYGGIEFKGFNDIRRTGYRYCCLEDLNSAVYSLSNILPIIVTTRLRKTGFQIKYKYMNGGSLNGPEFNVGR